MPLVTVSFIFPFQGAQLVDVGPLLLVNIESVFLLLLALFPFTLVIADSLYDASDPILELYTDDFNQAVYDSKKAHFIEFYSSRCGACIGYVPTFKKFARHLATWSDMVQVTVVNCADDKNMPLCREHSINAFPTLKDHNDGLPYNGNKHDLAQLELDVAGLVQADYEQQKPEGWPSFLPLGSGDSLQSIWSLAGDVNFVALVSQENPATMAWANMINFNNNRHVRLFLVRPQHSQALKYFATAANNRVLLYKKFEDVPLWKSDENVLWIDAQEKIHELITENTAQAQQPAPVVPVRVEPQIRESQGVPPAGVAATSDLSQFQVQLVDLQSAMSYMLYKEIPRRNIIDGEDLAGLKQWMLTLKKYAPGTTPMRRLFYRLDEWLQLQSSVTEEQWTAKLNEIQQSLGNPLPQEINWIACAGFKSNLRGYTCGHWLMQSQWKRSKLKNIVDTAFRPVIDVLDPFRQFITRFLSCSECAQNFQKEADTHQLHLVTRPSDVISWLWRVHNFVNKRLSGSPSDDPKFPKQQFPPKALCSECYDSAGNFDEEKTFSFVRAYYGTIKQDTVKPPVGYKVSEYENGKLKAAGARHLNPKFAIHAEKVDKLEAAEARLRTEMDASPQRQWRDIEGYEGNSMTETSRTQFYFIWLSVIGIAMIFAYCKYRRNRSKFWKTFYYHNDFKLLRKLSEWRILSESQWDPMRYMSCLEPAGFTDVQITYHEDEKHGQYELISARKPFADEKYFDPEERMRELELRIKREMLAEDLLNSGKTPTKEDLDLLRDQISQC